jgi:membrane protease YdiL (CAAX protease family)
VSYPLWILAIGWLGGAIGLGPSAPIPPRTPGTLDLTRLILLAPILEEIVYRESLQGAFQRRLGSVLAIPSASAVFAASHLDPWPVLASLILGIVLGIVLRLSGGIALGIGIHSGLNLSGVLFGAPPLRWALPIEAAAAAGALLLWLGVVRARATQPPT